MPAFNLSEHVHRRYNPMTGEWILVSPHRNKRPWHGRVDEAPADERPFYDPICYLCPGNTRANGAVNPYYTSTFVFDNDFAALRPDTPSGNFDLGRLLVAQSESGICRVICFSPRHDLTLAEMDVEAIYQVVDLWADHYADLGGRDDIRYVQIFENKGALMGCSNMHPHGQIWAQQTVPDEPAKETDYQRRYFEQNGTTLLSNYLAIELERGERIVCSNPGFVALVPFWALWPFETMIIARRPKPDLLALNARERYDLADILKKLTVRYDNLFQMSFPYSAGLHQAPTDGKTHPEWHFHMHVYPPLLRSATVQKFKVGYEMLGGGQRDLTAEESAERLKALREIHYKLL